MDGWMDGWMDDALLTLHNSVLTVKLARLSLVHLRLLDLTSSISHKDGISLHYK